MKKTEKQTPILSRKRKALRRIAIAAVVMFFVNYIMHIGLLLPVQAIWQIEELQGTSHTRVVTRDWVPEIHKTHIAYLTENENTTLFGSTYLTIYGWMAGFGIALDCSEEAPIYAGVSYMHREEDAVWYFFGRVDDPDIETLTISVQLDDWDNEAQTCFRREVRQLRSEGFHEKDGRRYFLLRDDGLWDYDTGSTPRPVVIGYDSAGEEVVRMEIEQWNSSSFG